MNTYVDQNFLINCANRPALRTQAVEAAASGKVSFVLSPWHFYEIGTTGPGRIKELLAVVEDLNPLWILERFDLQLAEFKQAWGQFWGTSYDTLVPIGSLPVAAAALLRTRPERLQGFALAHYVDVFRRLGTENIDPVLESEREIAAANQRSYREGKMTHRVKERIEHSYIAQQLASFNTKFSSHAEYDSQLHAVYSQPLLVEQIRFFVEWGGMRDLRAWWVESILTDHHHAGKAVLNTNRQVDRQHTIPALAYCDLFVTDDKELLKRCTILKQEAPFSVAETVTAEALVKTLS